MKEPMSMKTIDTCEKREDGVDAPGVFGDQGL